MTRSKEINLRKHRIIGCCNLCYDFRIMRPHEAGGFCAEVLEKLGLYTERSIGGINLSLINLKPRTNDLVLLDEVGLNIGNFKIRKLSSYGKRGHNAIKKTLNLAEISKQDPWVVLIGVGPIRGRLDKFVNFPMPRLDSLRLKISIISLVRGLILAWPNMSLVIQIGKETYSAFLKSKRC